jgi:hypothetical protein
MPIRVDVPPEEEPPEEPPDEEPPLDDDEVDGLVVLVVHAAIETRPAAENARTMASDASFIRNPF